MKCQLCSEITNSKTMFKYKDVPGSFLVLQVEAIQTIAEETRAEGNVSSHIYFTYFTAGCSLLVLMVIVFLSILAEVSHRPLMVPLASEWRFLMQCFYSL